MENLPSFFQNNMASFILALLLIVVVVWFLIKDNIKNKRFQNQKNDLISKHETELYNLQNKNLEFATTVFSWSVRSEILRDNTENINQLLTTFAQESSADLVQLVNPENNIIIISSDKKYEGTQFNKEINTEIKEPVILKEDKEISIITPIMGFNKKIGILIVKMNKLNNKQIFYIMIKR